MIKFSYDDVIEWMNARYDNLGFDFLTEDDIIKGRQTLIDQFDSRGSIGAFFGVMRSSTEKRIFQETEEPRFEDTMSSAIQSIDNKDDLKNIKILDDFTQETKDKLTELKSSRFEELSGEDITNASTTEDLADIKIPRDLTDDTRERLEEAKNIKFGELIGDELREKIESPETELSEFKQISKGIKRIPDEAIREDLSRSLKEEAERLGDINQSLLEDIRSQTDEPGLDAVISRIDDSDLRDRQKESLRNIAEARRDLGFPEISEV